MAEQFVLSKRDYERFQAVLRWAERNKNLRQHHRRRNITPTTNRMRKAYCKNDAGAGTTITCYLDTDGTGTEITVTCSVAQGGSALNAAVPRLKDGDLIFVSKIGATWYCTMIFMPSEDCDCYSAP